MKTLLKIALVAIVPVAITACSWFTDEHPHTISGDPKVEVDTTTRIRPDSSALPKLDSATTEQK